MKIFKSLCGLALLSGNVAANTAIFVCTDAQGHRTFTDRGCPGKTVYTPPAIAAVKFEPLAAAEAEQLRALGRRAIKTTQARQKYIHQHRKELARQKVERQRACEQSTSALATLVDKRRKGYRLTALAELDATEAALKKDKRNNCR